MKRFSDACERNRAPILAILKRLFTDRRHVLEIGSGTGQHAAYFAPALPQLAWQPSDVAENLPSVRLWREEAQTATLLEPIELDVDRPFPRVPADAVFSANTCHIISWPQVEKMFAGVSALLPPGAYSCSTDRSTTAASRPRRATLNSTPGCAAAIRRAASATSRTYASWRRAKLWCWKRTTPCRRITGCWFFAGVRTMTLGRLRILRGEPSVAERFDAIVIGAGQAGPALCARLDKQGLKTAIIERKLFGGTCVNTGCIPTKTLIASARAAHRRAPRRRLRRSRRRRGPGRHGGGQGAQGRDRRGNRAPASRSGSAA